VFARVSEASHSLTRANTAQPACGISLAAAVDKC